MASTRIKRVPAPQRRRRRVNPTLPPGICRVEQASTRTYGYVARVGHRPSPKGWRPKYTAYFGDHSHGGKYLALAAATKWLDNHTTSSAVPRAKR